MKAVFDASGLSQEAFAERARVSRGGLTKWLSGEQAPRYDSIEKLRAVAPLALRDPFGDTGATRAAAPSDGVGRNGPPPLKREAAEIAEHVNGVPEEEVRVQLIAAVQRLIPSLRAAHSSRRKSGS